MSVLGSLKKENTLVAVADVPTDKTAREYTQYLLQTGLVQTFFIEFSSEYYAGEPFARLLEQQLRRRQIESGMYAKAPGTPLSPEEAEVSAKLKAYEQAWQNDLDDPASGLQSLSPRQLMKEHVEHQGRLRKREISLELRSTFQKLRPPQADPSLLELSSEAIYNQAQIFACDLSREATLRELQVRRQGLHGLDSNIPLAVGETAIDDDEGLAVRDDFAARHISGLIGGLREQGLSKGFLLLWDARRFGEYIDGQNDYEEELPLTWPPSISKTPLNLLRRLIKLKAVAEICLVYFQGGERYWKIIR